MHFPLSFLFFSFSLPLSFFFPSFFFFFKDLFIYLWLLWVFIVAHRLLIAVAFFVVEHELGSCGSWAQLPCGACGISLSQGLNLCPQHWQARSPGKPPSLLFLSFFMPRAQGNIGKIFYHLPSAFPLQGLIFLLGNEYDTFHFWVDGQILESTDSVQNHLCFHQVSPAIVISKQLQSSPERVP